MDTSAQESCDFSDTRPSLAAILPNSGSERAFIFRIAWLRWTFTVGSLIPISPAICLLRRPRATSIMISRSLGLNDPKRSLSPARAVSLSRRARSRAKTEMNGVKQFVITDRLGKEFNGTFLHRLHRHPNVAVSCDEDDRDFPVCRGKLALKIKTALPWQSHVEHEAGRAIRRIRFEKF